ncbi:MAG: hypothetical protein K2K02_07930, partial [Ruminococcus sp.]|nr:hypothetical protein [Ruminococcus sp.]
MLKKILKIILAVWICMGIIDYTSVAVMEKKPVFCTEDEDCHYSGIGYEFFIYNLYSENPEYIFYILRQWVDD